MKLYSVQLIWHRSVQFFLLFIHFLNVQQMSWFVIIPPFVFSSGVEITDVNDVSAHSKPRDCDHTNYRKDKNV